MKYKQPIVEEYPDTDDGINHHKRKWESGDTPTELKEGVDDEKLKPPSKTSKLSKAPLNDPPEEYRGEEGEEVVGDDEEEEEEEDEDESMMEEAVEEATNPEAEEAEREEEMEEEEEGRDVDEELQRELEQAMENEEGEDDEEEEEGGEDGEGEEEEDEDEDDGDVEAEDKENDGEELRKSSPSGERVHKTIEEFGRAPLQGTAIAEKPLTDSPNTILAMLIDAMLKSCPISHNLAEKAVSKVIDAGFHDIRKLGDSSWEERTVVLKDGGYNRYREQGATNLGSLVELIDEKYDGDLNNLLKKANYDRQKTRELVKEIKGLGDVGVDLFFNNVQSVWPAIAPFVDARSLKTAREAGIGTDLDAIYEDLEQDSLRMSKLANALSAARLEKRVGDLLAI